MPIGIVIAVAAVLVVVTAVISHFLTVSNLKKNADCKIGNAETKAREIIDDAVKTAEAKKKELKKSRSRTRMNLKKRQRNAEQSYKDTRNVFFPRKRLWTKSPTLLRSVKQDLQQKKNSLSSAKRKWKS